MRWRSTAGARWSEPPRLISLFEEPLTPTRPGLLASWRSVSAAAGACAAGDAAAGAAAGLSPPFEQVLREAVQEHQRPRERGDGECRRELKRGHVSHLRILWAAAGPGSQQAATPAPVRPAPVPFRARRWDADPRGRPGSPRSRLV